MRRPKPERVATAVRLPVDLHRRLVDVAYDCDVSVNWHVTMAVREYLDRLDREASGPVPMPFGAGPLRTRRPTPRPPTPNEGDLR